jgi:precorrin-8X/cobalt-precorrin-8 methylmutase
MTESPLTERSVHPIEARSYAIMEQLVDFSSWPPGDRDVVARMVHSTADETFAESTRIGPRAVAAAVAGLRVRSPVICDTRMVAAGVPTVSAITAVECYIGRVKLDGGSITRSAAAVDMAAAEYPAGAIWVVGNAPTALQRIVELHAAGALEPVVVIGLPVGYVGAAEAKEALWASPLRPVAITNKGRRGGSPVAAAALNALTRML